MSFNISSKQEALPQQLFLEASAGTGKTFAIEHYIVRSILASELVPSKLFLVTFTRAVADELKMRLQRVLKETCSWLLAPSPTCPEYLIPYLEGDDYRRGEHVRHIEEALSHLHEATISTIHGCCDRLLSLWAEKEGIYSGQQWLSDYEQKEWIADYLKSQTLLSYGEWKTLGKRYAYNELGLVEAVHSFFQEQSLPIVPLETSVEEVRAKVSCLDQVSSALQKKAVQCRGALNKQGLLKEKLLLYFDAIERLIREGYSDAILAKLQGVNLSCLFALPRARSEAISPDFSHIVEVILTVLWPSLEHYCLPEGIIRRLAIDCFKRFSSYLKRSGKKTFESVLQDTFQLSKNPDFRAMAADAVSHLIVDEFQDTDCRQWEIFSQLFMHNTLWKGSILVVGDPKQAIYGFRKADVYSYFAARESFSSCRTLFVNYRADPRLVQALNSLFSGPAPLFYLPKAQKALPFLQLDSGKEKEELPQDGRGSLHFFIAKDSIGKKRRWPHEAMEVQTIFPWLADEMISLANRGVPFRSQAILVRDRYQAKRVQKFLQGRQIPTCAWKVDKVTESPFYTWLCKAFLLAAQPADQRKLSQLLLFFPTDEHKALCQEIAVSQRLDRWALCVKEWTGVREAFYRGGIGAMAKALFSCFWDGIRRTDEWLASFGRQAVLDVEHLFELLSRLEEDLPPSIEGFGEVLLQLEGRFSQNPEMLSQRIDPDDEGAPILTMHKSKGLEFDVVYALGCSSRTPVQENSEEGEAEKIRQLYVSVTRAKKRCYLPILFEEDGKKVLRGTASPTELLLAAHNTTQDETNWVDALYEKIHLKNTVERLSEEETITYSFAENELKGLPVSNLRLCPIPFRGWLRKKSTSCCSLLRLKTLVSSQHSYLTPLAQPLKEIGHNLSFKAKNPERSSSILSPLSRWKKNKYCSFSSMRQKGERLSHVDGSSSSALFGTEFHFAISKLIFEPFAVRSSLERITEWVGKNALVDSHELAFFLHKALETKVHLMGEMISLHEIQRDTMKVEAPFLDKGADGALYRGSIDLLFEWKKAVYCIDWKTNVVSEEISSYVEEHGYDLQARLYKEAIVRAYSPTFCWGGFFFIFVRSDEGVHYVP